ncbi:MAG: glycerate kinase type-2 family protein [Paracoccaceae bacterium]
MIDPRATALALFHAGLAAADPARAVDAALRAAPMPPGTHVLALGKAACAMIGAALAHLPDAPALAVTHTGTAPGARVVLGSHPVPDEASLAAGRAALDFASAVPSGGHLLALVSGGGSAIAVAPRAGVTLADKTALTAALLASGAEIGTMNLIRQRLSDFKGGGLARACPGEIRALVVSDVEGDDPAEIASGPVAPPLPGDPVAALRALGLWDGLRPAVRAALSTPLPDARRVPHGVVASSARSVAACAGATDLPTATARLTGDVADAARTVATAARAALPGPRALVWGGETTVTLRGTGRGGRNQELALRVAHALSGHPRPFAFLAGGTDGRDGPTDAAGGLVDAGTWARVGPDAAALLADNDSHAALSRAGDLLVTGATGTNVADLSILVLGA